MGSGGPTVPASGTVGPGPVIPVRGAGPSQGEAKGLGVHIALSSIDGLTSQRVLRKPYYFQCAPLDTMPRDYTWTWDEWVTLDGTTHSNPTAIGNSTYTFSSVIVDTPYRFVFVKDFDVLAMVRELQKIGDSMRPFQLQFGQPALWGEWDVVAAVTMRSLHVEERHPEIDARYFTVSFASYADVDVKLRSVPLPAAIVSASVGNGSATSAAPQRAGVVALLDSAVLPGKLDTMSKISKVYYRDPGQWPVIAKASGLEDVSANQNLRETVGSQQPAPRIVIPELRPGVL